MQAGEQFAGYLLEQELGRGGVGVVFRARDQGDGQLYALKVLLSGAEATPYQQERFRREAVALSRLRHPGIARIHRHGHERDRSYLAMDYVEGEPLDRMIARRGRLSPDTTARVMLGLADAVQHAHEQGILHRDIKPQNILIKASGAPVLTDFGLARLEQEHSMTRKGHLMGTPAYAAPEQLAGDRVSPRTDVYSLGATMFHLLTGRPPFEGTSNMKLITAVLNTDAPTPSSVSGDVDPRLEVLCTRCLRRVPDERYESAWELAEELRGYLAGDSASNSAPRPLLLAGLLLGGLLLLGVALSWAASRPMVVTSSSPTPPAKTLAETPRPSTTIPTPAAPRSPAPEVVEQWERVPTEHPPPARGHGAFVADVARGVAVLFGGRDATGLLGDTWEWDGHRWSHAQPAVSPQPRRAHAMAYDSQRRRVVLFGGSSGRAFLGDTWEWNGGRWVESKPTGKTPPPRSHGALSYAGDGKVLLFGGRHGPRARTLLGDTWTWDGQRWEQLPTPPDLRPRRNHGMAYDEGRNVVVLYGGRFGGAPTDQTWEWRVTWKHRRPETTPGPRRVPNALAYDSRAKRVVLFGGNANRQILGDTWGWDGTRWTPLARGGPSPRDWTHVTLEPVTGRVLLFGGDVGDDRFSRDLWAFRSRPR